MGKKIHPAKPVSQATGPTFTENDPAKFPNKGKTSGKTMGKPIEQKTGPTFTENSTLMPETGGKGTPKATKVIKSSTGRVNVADHETAKDHTASQSGPGGPTTVPYALKDSYEKSGKKDSIPNRAGD